jgi:hypothetical protein
MWKYEQLCLYSSHWAYQYTYNAEKGRNLLLPLSIWHRNCSKDLHCWVAMHCKTFVATFNVGSFYVLKRERHLVGERCDYWWPEGLYCKHFGLRYYRIVDYLKDSFQALLIRVPPYLVEIHRSLGATAAGGPNLYLARTPSYEWWIWIFSPYDVIGYWSVFNFLECHCMLISIFPKVKSEKVRGFILYARE